MAYTVSQLISDIQNQYPDCDTNKALRLINKSLSHLIQDAHGFTQTEDINLTDGTRFYALVNEYGKIDSCTYVSAANTAKSLFETSMEAQDEMYRGYRGAENAEGVPTHYAITTGSQTAYTHPVKLYVYLYPTPGTTTSGGYPLLKVTGSTHVALSTSSSLPNFILDPTWLEEEACWRLAKDAQKWSEVNERRAIAKDLREKQARNLVSIQSRKPIQIGSGYAGDRTF